MFEKGVNITAESTHESLSSEDVGAAMLSSNDYVDLSNDGGMMVVLFYFVTVVLFVLFTVFFFG